MIECLLRHTMRGTVATHSHWRKLSQMIHFNNNFHCFYYLYQQHFLPDKTTEHYNFYAVHMYRGLKQFPSTEYSELYTIDLCTYFNHFHVLCTCIMKTDFLHFFEQPFVQNIHTLY